VLNGGRTGSWAVCSWTDPLRLSKVETAREEGFAERKFGVGWSLESFEIYVLNILSWNRPGPAIFGEAGKIFQNCS